MSGGRAAAALHRHRRGRDERARGRLRRARRRRSPAAIAASPLIWSDCGRRGSSRRSATTPPTCPTAPRWSSRPRSATGNPELALARERGQKVIHRGELLAELCAEKRLIAIAGTHGKTTTTSMTVWALRGLGEDPAFFVGGEVPGLGPDGAPANAGWGESEWVVAEADESDGSFLRLDPEIAVDHQRRDGPPLEMGLARAADRGLRRLRRQVPRRRPARAEPRGRRRRGGPRRADRSARASSHFRPHSGPNCELTGGRLRARSQFSGLFAESANSSEEGPEVAEFSSGAPGPEELDLAVPGRTTCSNARASLAALGAAGFDLDRAAVALADFRGVRRRLEVKGERGGVRIYDDYAHHPTEVRAALSALRELDPTRLVAVFQPHLYSRTKVFATQFGAALALADEVAVLDVYPAREEPDRPPRRRQRPRRSPRRRRRRRRQTGRLAPDRREGRGLSRAVASKRCPAGSFLVTIGAGDVFKLGEALVKGTSGDPGRTSPQFVREGSPDVSPRHRAELPPRPPDHRPHRRPRRLLRPPVESQDDLVALLAWAKEVFRSGRSDRLGIEPPGSG